MLYKSYVYIYITIYIHINQHDPIGLQRPFSFHAFQPGAEAGPKDQAEEEVQPERVSTSGDVVDKWFLVDDSSSDCTGISQFVNGEFRSQPESNVFDVVGPGLGRQPLLS